MVKQCRSHEYLHLYENKNTHLLISLHITYGKLIEYLAPEMES